MASILNNAQNTSIHGGTWMINGNAGAGRFLDALNNRVAPHAVLNEGGRAEDAKCHPGTREEVIGLIERWRDAATGDRILWLSGPAGGGKTAIMKTIAERSANQGVQTINFFFFRGDSTRNSVQPVVPSLLYQLFELYPTSLKAVGKITSARPRILDETIAQQCKLISTLFPIIQKSKPAGSPQIILLIDGLDECDDDAERSQGDILYALEALVKERDSPVRLLVASRPEARIQMAFNQLTLHAQTIFLDEKFSPERDIRCFVISKLDKIKVSHPLARFLPSDWPLHSDIEDVVRKSSGQFIYAATVMHYLARPSTVPSLSLEHVNGVVPTTRNSPFMHLDSIYHFILSQAENQDAMHDILSMTLLQASTFDFPALEILRQYGPRYSQAFVESCLSDLSAIVRRGNKDGCLEFYHASLEDFLLDQARSDKHWIDIDAFKVDVLSVIWEKPAINDPDYHATLLQPCLFGHLRKATRNTTDMLLNWPCPSWMMDEDWIRAEKYKDFLSHVYLLYYSDHPKIYDRILHRLTRVEPESFQPFFTFRMDPQVAMGIHWDPPVDLLRNARTDLPNLLGHQNNRAFHLDFQPWDPLDQLMTHPSFT